MTSNQPPGPGAVTVSADQATTRLAALYVAAGYHHDRADLCTDCTDQSCATCQWRLQTGRHLRPASRPDHPGRRSLRHTAAGPRPHGGRQQ